MGMTRKEFSYLVKGMKSIYPDPKFIPDQFAFDMWYKLFEDVTYQSASIGVQTYMRAGKRPPTPADILDCISLQDEENHYPTEQEAWAMVAKACSNGNYGYHEEFAKLPKIIQKAVGNEMNIHNWAAVDIAEFQTVVESNFLRSYRAAVKADKEFKRYPEQLKQLITKTTERLIAQVD